MSDFELQHQGDGRFVLSGEMSFSTANDILKCSESVFGEHASLEIDMSGVERADSAGLALLLEWKSQAAQRQCNIRFVAMPESLLAIAKTTEVSELL